MKLNIPFKKSIKDTECGPRALQMVLKYFGKNYSINKLSKLTKQLPSGLTWTQGIAVAAKKLGFNVKIFSKSNFLHEEKRINYYNKLSKDEGIKVLKELIRESKRLKIPTEEKNLSINQLKKLITPNSIPIALINWFVLSKRKGYSGHFLTLSGYDRENIYVHNPGIANAQEFLPIKNRLFKKAWESPGTDKDLIVISKNKL